jgi:GNAT superfamily N-acetyltransferase
MPSEERFVVRRCDPFYRCWHDVTDPASMCITQAAYERLTHNGTCSTTPDDAEYYDIFAADPLSGWDDPPAPQVRRLHACDAGAIEAHLLGLNGNDRRLRFCSSSTDAQIRAYVQAIDWSRSLLLGAICADRVVGMAEALLDCSHAPSDAEIAVSVDAELRRRGLGHHLVSQAVARAAALGARHSSFAFLLENRAIQRIVRSLGGLLDMDDLIGVVRAAEFGPAAGHADALGTA